MATIVEKIHLVKSDPEKNNNKFWIGELYDNGDVNTRWGRVGDTGQSKMYPSVGQSFLEKKVKSKKKARNGEIPYREVEILSENNTISIKAECDLRAIAKKQIKYSDIEVSKLIDYLTEQNIHDITNFTSQNITYNYNTNGFETPMGAVSQRMIDSARDTLNDIANLVANKDYGDLLMEKTRDLLMLVPQNIGRKKLELHDFWSNKEKVKQQNDLLDGLQASLETITSSVAENTTDEDAEFKVFDTHMELIKDKKTLDRLFSYYHNTKSPMHACHRYNPINAWEVSISGMNQEFQNDGAKMPNIVEGFHGSGTANILSLLKSGMLIRPPKNAHVSGALYGNGIYCAPMRRVGAKELTVGSSTKALGYSTSFWGGKNASRTFMFIVDMAMGNYYKPDRSNYMRVSYPVNGYDSTWAFGGVGGVKNDEAIVYRESQVNIKYLIELK